MQIFLNLSRMWWKKKKNAGITTTAEIISEDSTEAYGNKFAIKSTENASLKMHDKSAYGFVVEGRALQLLTSGAVQRREG